MPVQLRPDPASTVEKDMKTTLSAMVLALAATGAYAEGHQTPVTIEFAYPYSHLFDITYESILQRFNEDHPHITVEFRATYENYEDGTNTILREAVAGELPDVTMQGLNRQAILVERGIARPLTDFIAAMGLTPFGTMLIIVLFYLVIGCFMETLSMMIATVPIIAPIVISLGYDPVWFGVLLMLLLETALITPPIVVNLYVVQGVRGRGAITDVIIGTLPFIATMFVMIALLLAWPGMATWLPQQLLNN